MDRVRLYDLSKPNLYRPNEKCLLRYRYVDNFSFWEKKSLLLSLVFKNSGGGGVLPALTSLLHLSLLQARELLRQIRVMI